MALYCLNISFLLFVIRSCSKVCIVRECHVSTWHPRKDQSPTTCSPVIYTLLYLSIIDHDLVTEVAKPFPGFSKISGIFCQDDLCANLENSERLYRKSASFLWRLRHILRWQLVSNSHIPPKAARTQQPDSRKGHYFIIWPVIFALTAAEVGGEMEASDGLFLRHFKLQFPSWSEERQWGRPNMVIVEKQTLSQRLLLLLFDEEETSWTELSSMYFFFLQINDFGEKPRGLTQTGSCEDGSCAGGGGLKDTQTYGWTLNRHTRYSFSSRGVGITVTTIEVSGKVPPFSPSKRIVQMIKLFLSSQLLA